MKTLARLLALAALTAAGAAHAGGVNWSIGISLPPLVIAGNSGHGGDQGYAGPPVVYTPPAPVYYAPPRVYAPVPVYYALPRVVYAPTPVYYAPRVRHAVVVHGWHPPGHQRKWKHHKRGNGRGDD